MTLLQSPHPSTSPVTLGYQDIYNLFHTDRFPLLKTTTGSHFSPRSIIHWNALPAHIPVLPTLALGTVQECCLTGDPCLSLNTSFCFYLLTILTLFSNCTNSFLPLFLSFYFSYPPSTLGLPEPPSDVPPPTPRLGGRNHPWF